MSQFEYISSQITIHHIFAVSLRPHERKHSLVKCNRITALCLFLIQIFVTRGSPQWTFVNIISSELRLNSWFELFIENGAFWNTSHPDKVRDGNLYYLRKYILYTVYRALFFLMLIVASDFRISLNSTPIEKLPGTFACKILRCLFRLLRWSDEPSCPNTTRSSKIWHGGPKSSQFVDLSNLLSRPCSTIWTKQAHLQLNKSNTRWYWPEPRI